MPTTIYNKTETDDLLNLKVDKVTGKQLSTEDFTTAEKTKLAGIADGAEVNVNADWNATSGDAQILNKPAIPSKTSDLTNDSDFITSSAVASGYVAKDGSKVLSDNNYDSTSKSKLDNLANITAIGDNLTLTNGTLSAPASGADTDLSNLTTTGKNTVIALSIPDFVNATTVAAVNTVYQADKASILYCRGVSTSAGASIVVYASMDEVFTSGRYYATEDETFSSGSGVSAHIQVPAGWYYKIYTNAVTVSIKQLIPLAGASV